jgi:hypothetical protein
MLHAADVVGLGSAACALAALLLSLPGVSRLRRRWPAATLPVALALPLIPLPELPAAGYLRGLVGDLSATTTLLLLHHLLRPVLRLPPVGERSRVALQALVAAGGLLLYPMTLGFGPADPYRLGFAHAGFVWALLLLALAAGYGRLHLVASCLAIGVAAWAAGALESRNLWDYLLDPLVTAWALGGLTRSLASSIRAKVSAVDAATRRWDARMSRPFVFLVLSLALLSLWACHGGERQESKTDACTGNCPGVACADRCGASLRGCGTRRPPPASGDSRPVSSTGWASWKRAGSIESGRPSAGSRYSFGGTRSPLDGSGGKTSWTEKSTQIRVSVFGVAARMRSPISLTGSFIWLHHGLSLR